MDSISEIYTNNKRKCFLESEKLLEHLFNEINSFDSSGILSGDAPNDLNQFSSKKPRIDNGEDLLCDNLAKKPKNIDKDIIFIALSDKEQEELNNEFIVHNCTVNGKDSSENTVDISSKLQGICCKDKLLGKKNVDLRQFNTEVSNDFYSSNCNELPNFSNKSSNLKLCNKSVSNSIVAKAPKPVLTHKSFSEIQLCKISFKCSNIINFAEPVHNYGPNNISSLSGKINSSLLFTKKPKDSIKLKPTKQLAFSSKDKNTYEELDSNANVNNNNESCKSAKVKGGKVKKISKKIKSPKQLASSVLDRCKNKDTFKEFISNNNVDNKFCEPTFVESRAAEEISKLAQSLDKCIKNPFVDLDHSKNNFETNLGSEIFSENIKPSYSLKQLILEHNYSSASCENYTNNQNNINTDGDYTLSKQCDVLALTENVMANNIYNDIECNDTFDESNFCLPIITDSYSLKFLGTHDLAKSSTDVNITFTESHDDQSVSYRNELSNIIQPNKSNYTVSNFFNMPSVVQQNDLVSKINSEKPQNIGKLNSLEYLLDENNEVYFEKNNLLDGSVLNLIESYNLGQCSTDVDSSVYGQCASNKSNFSNDTNLSMGNFIVSKSFTIPSIAQENVLNFKIENESQNEGNLNILENLVTQNKEMNSQKNILLDNTCDTFTRKSISLPSSNLNKIRIKNLNELLQSPQVNLSDQSEDGLHKFIFSHRKVSKYASEIDDTEKPLPYKVLDDPVQKNKAFMIKPDCINSDRNNASKVTDVTKFSFISNKLMETNVKPHILHNTESDASKLVEKNASKVADIVITKPSVVLNYDENDASKKIEHLAAYTKDTDNQKLNSYHTTKFSSFIFERTLITSLSSERQIYKKVEDTIKYMFRDLLGINVYEKATTMHGDFYNYHLRLLPKNAQEFSSILNTAYEDCPTSTFTCSYCKEAFTSQRLLLKHNLTHMQFSCNHCDKIFKSEKLLKVHVMDYLENMYQDTHSGFKCSSCFQFQCICSYCLVEENKTIAHNQENNKSLDEERLRLDYKNFEKTCVINTATVLNKNRKDYKYKIKNNYLKTNANKLVQENNKVKLQPKSNSLLLKREKQKKVINMENVGQTYYICSYCSLDKIFRTYYFLRFHIEIYHNDKFMDFLNNVVHNEIRSKKYLVRHNSLNIMSVRCKHCHAVFEKVKLFCHHVFYKCQVCQNKFFFKSIFNYSDIIKLILLNIDSFGDLITELPEAEMMLNKEVIDVKCNICKQHFICRDHLLAHSSLHTNELKCYLCFKTFQDKKHLELDVHRHLYSNTVFKCSVCSKCFGHSTSFIKHRIMAHYVFENSETDINDSRIMAIANDLQENKLDLHNANNRFKISGGFSIASNKVKQNCLENQTHLKLNECCSVPSDSRNTNIRHKECNNFSDGNTMMIVNHTLHCKIISAENTCDNLSSVVEMIHLED